MTPPAAAAVTATTTVVAEVTEAEIAMTIVHEEAVVEVVAGTGAVTEMTQRGRASFSATYPVLPETQMSATTQKSMGR